MVGHFVSQSFDFTKWPTMFFCVVKGKPCNFQVILASSSSLHFCFKPFSKTNSSDPRQRVPLMVWSYLFFWMKQTAIYIITWRENRPSQPYMKPSLKATGYNAKILMNLITKKKPLLHKRDWSIQLTSWLKHTVGVMTSALRYKPTC